MRSIRVASKGVYADWRPIVQAVNNIKLGRLVSRFAAGRIGRFLFEPELVAALAADQVLSRIRGGELRRKASRHIVNSKIAVVPPALIAFRNLRKA